MTVSVQNPINTYTGNGSATAYSFTFRCDNASDLRVYVNDVLQTITTHYTLSGLGNNAGGTVTFVSAPGNGLAVRIQRSLALTRTTDYQEGASLPSSTVDLDIDNVVMMVQDLDYKLDEAILGGVTPQASSIEFDPYGNLTSVNVQTAIQELDDEKQPLIAAGTTAQFYRGDKSWQTVPAVSVSFSPAGNIAASNVQAALEELDSEKSGTSHGHTSFDNNFVLGSFTGSAWASGYRTLELGTKGNGIASSTSGEQIILTSNAYWNGSNWKFANTGDACLLDMNNGQLTYLTLGSGTADANATFATRFIVDADGKVAVNTTTDSTAQVNVDTTVNGVVGVTSGASYAGVAGYGTSATAYGGFFMNTNSACTGTVLDLKTNTAASTAFYFLGCVSDADGTPDVEFGLRGDGNGYCDGAWNGGGADYAEYFEWLDGNPNKDDRVGFVVVLEDGKIRPVTDEDPEYAIIGVVSARPSMVGNSAALRWDKKYRKDAFGRYRLDPNGRRILTPEFDATKKYKPREERKEWACVGVLGRLRLHKGQKVPNSWRFIQAITDNIDEYWVK